MVKTIILGAMGSILGTVCFKFLWDRKGKMSKVQLSVLLTLVMYFFAFFVFSLGINFDYLGFDFYEGVIFREIARNSNACGDLSFTLVCSAVSMFLISLTVLFLLQDELKYEHFKKAIEGIVATPKRKKWLARIIIVILILVSESTIRKFYIREMVAYYNQMVNIVSTPASYKDGRLRMFFDSRLAQVGTKEQFYAIEALLLEQIKQANLEEPQRLRDKMVIPVLGINPLKHIFETFFPRPQNNKGTYYEKTKAELDKIKGT